MDFQEEEARESREEEGLEGEAGPVTKQDVGLLFRSVRKAYCYSQKQLSHELSISQGFLSKIESGMSHPDVYVWLKLCQLFKFEPHMITDKEKFYSSLEQLSSFRGGSDRQVAP